jgi:hypothetical protein
MWKPCLGQGFRFFSISKDMGPEGRLSALVRGALKDPYPIFAIKTVWSVVLVYKMQLIAYKM